MRNPPTRKIGEFVHDFKSAMAFLERHPKGKLAANTIIFYLPQSGYYGNATVCVKLYNTVIVTYYESGAIELNSGGHRTRTTAQRINQLLPPGWHVVQRNYDWWLENAHHRGKSFPFFDGMTFHPDTGQVSKGTEPRASNPESFGTFQSGWGDELELYGWIITRDHLENESVTVMGPRNIPKEAVAMLKAGKGRPFKLYDDDGELYYSGRYVGPDDESLLGPLDDYGAPNAGCTVIKYRDPTSGKWEEP